MADNKRFVSYMYEYKNDEKGQSAGYARIEARGNQCKFFIHIAVPELEGRLLKAYLFYRKPTKHRFAYLGNILVNHQVGELKVKSDRDNVMNSDLSFEDMCGVIVYSDRSMFLGCEWDELPITHTMIDHIENLDLAFGADVKVESRRKEDETQKDEALKEVAVKEHREQNIVEKAINTNSDEVSPLQDEIKKQEEKMNQEDNKKQAVKSNQEEKRENVQQDSAEFVAPSMENIGYNNIDYYEEKSRYAVNEMTKRNNEQQLLHSESLEEDLQKTIYMDIECIEPTYGPFQTQQLDSHQVMAQSGRSRMQCHPTAEKIFKKFPRITPFEDHEITDCVRLEPQDIGLLPIESWVLGNNSFLLHGYYTYRHLIFGRIYTTEGYIYVLGVPGVYQSRESFMAKMFGFDYFKCAKCTEAKNGEFGYYYIPIPLN